MRKCLKKNRNLKESEEDRMKDYLKELGFGIDDKVSCQCADDNEAWVGVVDRDSTGSYFIASDAITYYSIGADKLMLVD